MQEKKYRLITRSNLDGIISAVLLKKLNLIDESLFVHPKDVQDGKIKIDSNDIVTNLPYVNSAHMAFDYKIDIHDKDIKLNPHHALFTDAHSASQIIYEYYDCDESFGSNLYFLVDIANRANRADYTKDEILSPKGWDLLTFLTDPRTGLGRFKNFSISNYALMSKLIDLILNYDIDEILAIDDIKERIELYNKYQEDSINQLKRCITIENNIGVIDFRDEEVIYPTNRFMVYALFPQIDSSIHILNGVNNQNIVFALGKSIFNKNNKNSICEIVSKYGGGGHSSAGTAQVSHEDALRVKFELIDLLKQEQK